MQPVSLESTFDGMQFRQDVELGQFNGHPLVALRLDGPKRAPGWEMHPDPDELFYVVDGHMKVTLMTADRPEVVDLPEEASSSSRRGTGISLRRSSPRR